LGRVIFEGAKRVRISGNDINVRAQIRRIEHYSAHADQEELLEWIGDREPINGGLFLSHGEPDGMEAMRREMQKRAPHLSVRLPEIGETYELQPGEPAKRTVTGREDLALDTGRDWQNSYADFVTSLKARLVHIQDERKRQEAIDDMRHVLESYQEFKDRRATRD
jgi:metallo-beta-lactamase family protein